MAILRNRDLSLEVQYRAFERGWVEYAIWVRWKDEPVINDAILKRRGPYWGKRPKGAFLASQEQECGILPLLRKVLETNQADYWEPLDPDILLAIYPDDGFPFLPSRWQQLYDRPDLGEKFEAEEKERRAKPRRPDDLMELMLSVDIYNLDGCDAYSASGLCFRLYRRPVPSSLSSTANSGPSMF